VAPYAGNFKPFARASLILIGLAWTLPFLQPVHHFPMPSFYSEWLAIVLGLLALAPLVRRADWDEVTVPPVAVAALLLVALIWMQYALGLMPYLGQALTPSVHLVWAALLVLMGALLRQRLGLEETVTVLAWALVAGGMVSALAGIAQHYQVASLVGTWVTPTRTAQVYGNMSQPNHYASYSAMSLACLAYLVGRGKLAALPAIVPGAVLTFAAALSGSRSMWIYLSAVLVLAIILHRRAPEPATRRLLLVCAVLPAAFAATNAIAVLPWLLPPEATALTSLERLFSHVSGASVRFALWQEALWMFAQAPLFGAGFGQFAAQHFEHSVLFGPVTDVGLPNNAHNIVLHLMAETGLIGASLIVGGIAFWLAGLRGARASCELWWLLAMAAILALHSLLEFPLWYSYFLGIAAVVLGVGSMQGWRLGLARVGPPLVALVMAIGLINAVWTFRDFRRMEQLVFKRYEAQAEVPAEAVFEEVLVDLYRDPMLAPYVDTVVAYAVTVSEDKLPEKLDLVERAVKFAPNANLTGQRALLLALGGDRGAALTQLHRTLRVYPAAGEGMVTRIEELAQLYPGRFEPLLEAAAGAARAARKNP
jgi:O-antigen ligase